MESSGVAVPSAVFWEKLDASRSVKDEWRVLSVAPSITDRLLGGISRTGYRCLLIGLRDEEEFLTDTKSRGLSVRTEQLTEGSQKAGAYLVVECIDATGHPLFNLIAGDLAVALQSANPATAVTRVLGKWRRFWGQVPRTMMSREEQLGLFAELWFLLYWMFPAVGTELAMKRWRGPVGARRDFEWTEHAIEVKCSTIVRGPVFRISSIDQLDAGSDELWLFGLRVREDGSSPLNLPDLVTACFVALEQDSDSQMRFESILACSGYSRIFESEYRMMLLRIVDAKLYKVSDDFPKLIASSFTRGVPNGVSEVNYSIDLGGFSGPILSVPTEAQVLLR